MSGLPVARYDAVDLETAPGRIHRGRVESRKASWTPGGTVQPFTWVAATRDGAQASS